MSRRLIKLVITKNVQDPLIPTTDNSQEHLPKHLHDVHLCQIIGTHLSKHSSSPKFLEAFFNSKWSIPNGGLFNHTLDTGGGPLDPIRWPQCTGEKSQNKTYN